MVLARNYLDVLHILLSGPANFIVCSYVDAGALKSAGYLNYSAFTTEENNYERHHRNLSVLRCEKSDTRR